MQAVELIRKKRDGHSLSTEEISWFIAEYMREQIPDYQMSSWLMAVYWQGMGARETSDLTMAMARSGEELHVRDVILPVVDKHSTGGVGDKVTLVVPSISWSPSQDFVPRSPAKSLCAYLRNTRLF